jgi:hypothetical protein
MAGQEWGATSAANKYSAPFRDAYIPNVQGLAQWAQNVFAGFADVVQEPMLMGLRAAVFARKAEGGRSLDSTEGRNWLQITERVGASITLLAAALRSELPGMPTLSVPYSVQGSPWTTNERTLRVPWRRELYTAPGRTDSILIRAAQIMEAPVRVLRLGVLPSPLFMELRDAFISDPLWQKAANQVRALTSEDRMALHELSRELQSRLTEHAVTNVAGPIPIDRLQLREQIVAEALLDERFCGRIGDWRVVFNLLEALLRVIQQIVVFGGIPLLTGEIYEANFETISGETRARIVLESYNPFNVRGGWAVLVNSDVASDAITVESINSNVSLTSEPSRLVIEGLVLPGSGTELRPSALPSE